MDGKIEFAITTTDFEQAFQNDKILFQEIGKEESTNKKDNDDQLKTESNVTSSFCQKCSKNKEDIVFGELVGQMISKIENERIKKQLKKKIFNLLIDVDENVDIQ